ncbi:MAG TPA: hypothetical protein VGJ93_05960 [Desulfuromonadaceae bacterium]
MEQHLTEPVELERIRRDATCIIIRVGLGPYELRGPQENILVPESRVAWATVVHDLQGEGYVLVTPEEYAEATGASTDEVTGQINEQGSLFAIAYDQELVVPLPQKEAVFPDIGV